MARTVRQVGLKPSASDERPTPIPLSSPGFRADLGLIEATQVDDTSVILVPAEYIWDPNDSLDASWRGEEGAGRCWKTTVIYEQIGETHPHLVPFIRRGPWTACPVIAKPSGPPVESFIEKARAAMYSAPLDALSTRILASHRPLMYQWALHLISGLSFIHTHDIIFGDLDLAKCWLSSDSHLSLSIVGFLDAGFTFKTTGRSYPGDRTSSAAFHPLEHPFEPTAQIDLFLYGCVVYELMTGAWPGSRLTGTSRREITMMIPSKRWPVLETEYMGEIVRKCWGGGFENAEQVKAEVVAFLEGLGWEIEGNDNLKGFDVADLEF